MITLDEKSKFALCWLAGCEMEIVNGEGPDVITFKTRRRCEVTLDEEKDEICVAEEGRPFKFMRISEIRARMELGMRYGFERIG